MQSIPRPTSCQQSSRPNSRDRPNTPQSSLPPLLSIPTLIETPQEHQKIQNLQQQSQQQQQQDGQNDVQRNAWIDLYSLVQRKLDMYLIPKKGKQSVEDGSSVVTNEVMSVRSSLSYYQPKSEGRVRCLQSHNAMMMLKLDPNKTGEVPVRYIFVATSSRVFPWKCALIF